MNRLEYNLLTEPWIIVSGLNGSIPEKVSLCELFRRAHEFKGLCGECETQNIALIRLCLAVLTAVISRYDEDGDEAVLEDEVDAMNRWSTWWNAKELPFDLISHYLDLYRDRFNLFDEKYPFYQDAETGRELQEEYKTKPAKKDISEVAKNYLNAGKLIGDLSESGNKVRLFKSTAQTVLEPDEAARWIVNFMNTDDKSEKKPTPKNCGFLGEIGCVSVEGDNLFETFMLNLVLTDQYAYKETPVWETDDMIGANRVLSPQSLSELYTFQSRRLFLDVQEGKIVGFKSKAGNCVEALPLFEPMTMWRIKDSERKPRKHDSAASLWRNFSLLVSDSNENAKPNIVRWLSLLINENILPESYCIKFRSVGIEYGSMQSSIANVFDDSVSFSALILNQKNEACRNSIDRQLEITKKWAEVYARLVSKLFLAAGGDKGERGKNLTEQKAEGRAELYAVLDLPFRVWLTKVGTVYKTAEEIGNSWWDTLKGFGRRLSEERLRNISDGALFGRSGNSAAEAFNWFSYCTSTVERLEKEVADTK